MTKMQKITSPLFSILFLLLSLLAGINSSSFFGTNGQISDKSVINVEKSKIDTPEKAQIEEVADSFSSNSGTPAPARNNYTGPSSYFQINGRIIPLFYSSDTTIDAGSAVAKWGDKFYYGHNSSSVFAVLYNVGIGSTFSITENGNTTSYRVANIKYFFKKNYDGGGTAITKTPEANDNKNYMNSVAAAKYDGASYDVSLMTCYGDSWGNGDAAQRLVVFANKI